MIAFIARHRQRLLTAAAWVVLIGAYQTWAWRSGMGPAESVERLVDVLSGSLWGPVIYVAIYLVRPLLLFSAAVLTVAGGFLFGPLWGMVIVILAANASAMVAYTVGRWFQSGEPTEGDSRLGRYVARIRSRAFETILTLRLLLLPYDPVSYLAGFVRANPLAFLAGTALGSLPGTVAFVLFGASIEDFDGGVPALDGRVLVVSALTLVASLVLVRIVRRREGVEQGA